MRTRTYRPRVTERQCHQVANLIALGLSDRTIAADANLSRGTVARIRRGYRPPAPDPDLGPVERCPECGRLVHTPCVYCRAVEYLAKKGVQPCR